MRRSRFALSLLLGATALGFAGCGGGRPTSAVPLPKQLDTEKFRYGPLTSRSSVADVIAWLGSPAKDPYNRSSPVGEHADEIGLPDAMQAPPHSRDHTLRYPGATVFVSYRSKHYQPDASTVYALLLTAPGTHTERRVGIGSRLRAVATRYPELQCGQAGTSEFGYFPYCAGRVGTHRWLWFGEDPVRSITLSTAPLQQ